jgi:tetratricopeptide (TPR) repeat protein
VTRAAAPVVTARASARCGDPRVAALRAALDFGRIEEVRAHLSEAARAPEEEAELRARAAALEGRTLEALRLLEARRQAQPADPTTYAALAEIYGSAQKFDTAWQELQRGEQACGKSAELLRARGILWILREGGAAKGLELLEQARAADPQLAFAQRALAQAHLLAAKLAAKKEDYLQARAQVELSLSFDGRDVDARRLEADLAAANGEFTRALAILQELVAGGEPLTSELALLYKKAAIGSLLARRRDLALERLRAARELGLSDEELGSGAVLLAEEARERTLDGLHAYEQGDLVEAETCFELALRWQPTEVAALNHLAVIQFKRQQYAQAAAGWRAVLAAAAREGLTLPEPVHLNLAKALYQGGDAPAAERVLHDYLESEPEGRWSASTQSLLDGLSAAAPR